VVERSDTTGFMGEEYGIPAGCQRRAKVLGWHPCRDAGFLGDVIRWCRRCAPQPPATGWEASGFGKGGGRRLGIPEGWELAVGVALRIIPEGWGRSVGVALRVIPERWGRSVGVALRVIPEGWEHVAGG